MVNEKRGDIPADMIEDILRPDIEEETDKEEKNETKLSGGNGLVDELFSQQKTSKPAGRWKNFFKR